jgi:putative protein kinase ArgK-like GTPase of G3E family
VENTERALRGLLQLAHPAGHHPVGSLVGQAAHQEGTTQGSGLFWEPPLLRTVAIDDNGISDLVSEIDNHREYLQKSGDWGKQARLRQEVQLDHLLKTELVSRWRVTVSELHVQSVLDRLATRELSPWQAVELLLDGGNE